MISFSDYYPFGSIMPGRGNNPDSYRYGFNGMEEDNTLKGPGNSYDFGARMYDSRLGRWMSVDPVFNHSTETTYQFAGNSPIQYIDPDGLYRVRATIDGQRYVFKFDPRQPQEFAIKVPGGRFQTFDFKTSNTSFGIRNQSSMGLMAGSYSNKINRDNNTNGDFHKLKNSRMLIEVDGRQTTVNPYELLNKLVMQNKGVKIIIVGNHKISGKRLDPDCSLRQLADNNCPPDPFRRVMPNNEQPQETFLDSPNYDESFEHYFNFERAKTVKEEFFAGNENVIPKSRQMLNNEGQPIEVDRVNYLPVGKDPVGITISIRLEPRPNIFEQTFDWIKKIFEPKNNEREKSKTVRFL